MGNHLSSILNIPPSLLLPAIVTLLALLIMRPKAFQFIARYSLFLFWFLLSACYGILRGILFPGDRQDLNYYTSKFFTRIIPFLGIRHSIRGVENLENRPCVYVMNHQSSMDMVSLSDAMPRNTFTVAKKSLLYVPFLGLFMKLGSNIFITRENRESAIKSMERAGREVRERKAGVLIFPEGTRSRQGAKMLPFKKGAFNLAVGGQVPIVPLVVSSQKEVYDSQTWSFPGGDIEVSVLPPIPTEGKTRDDVNDLCQYVWDVMTKELEAQELRMKANKNPKAKTEGSGKAEEKGKEKGKGKGKGKQKEEGK